jgi:hypothetical protein
MLSTLWEAFLMPKEYLANPLIRVDSAVERSKNYLTFERLLPNRAEHGSTDGKETSSP